MSDIKIMQFCVVKQNALAHFVGTILAAIIVEGLFSNLLKTNTKSRKMSNNDVDCNFVPIMVEVCNVKTALKVGFHSLEEMH